MPPMTRRNLSPPLTANNDSRSVPCTVVVSARPNETSPAIPSETLASTAEKSC